MENRGKNGAVGGGIEGGVERAVGIEAGNVGAGGTGHGGESAGEGDLAVGGEREAAHFTITD